MERIDNVGRPKTERRIIVCEELNLSWRNEQIEDMLRLYKEQYSIHQISKYFRRSRQEILIALIDILPESDLAEMLGEWWGVKVYNKPKKFECID